jgi:cellulose synthase/poly-beta-1,6-N-acetylglucosamine synthase-like glycosyltransferase
VVIPAQNEESTISRCIRTVKASGQASARCAQLWVVVVADRCTDRTLELSYTEVGRGGEVVMSDAGSPGRARRLGAAAVMRHFALEDPRRIWLANTDADTHVPIGWLDTHLQLAADAHAETVAGIVTLDAEGLRADVEALYRSTYILAADGTHSHVHGANLGVRGDAYLDVGGFSDLTVSEDHCLWRRLLRRRCRVKSRTRSVVHTSGRLRGRAVGGFADTLTGC